MSPNATPTPTVILDAAVGKRGRPFGSPIEDLAARGYVMEEFIIGGVARSYRRISQDEGGIDGVWQTEVADTAAYTTRIYVVRPKDPRDFNGTVLVHWQNVTMGVDLGYPGDAEIFRGYAWVGVSAQKVGVDGVPGATPGLTSWDPERYGSLHHPGDAFSFDIFAQVGRLLRDGPARGLIDPLRGARPRTTIAMGASQSASRLATYINAVLPHDRLFDGFYLIVHWGICSLTEGESIEARMTWQGGGRYRGTSKINDRGETPVLVLATECEALFNYPARQPDTDTYRFWEIAGASHTDPGSGDVLGEIMAKDGLVRRASPTRNRVAWNYVKDAGLRSLVTWVQKRTPPPCFAPITVNQPAEGPPVFVRGSTGNVEGGIRPPDLTVATGLHKGANDQPGILRLSGESQPFGLDEMLRLHGSRAGFLETWDAAVEALFQAGLMDAPQRDGQRERGRGLWPG